MKDYNLDRASLPNFDEYKKQIDEFDKFKTITDKKSVEGVLKIWDEFKNIPEISKIIWGSHKNTPPTNRGCGECVASALRSVVIWNRQLQKSIDYAEFKGVPQAKVTEEVITTLNDEPKDKYDQLSGADYSKTITLEGTKGKPDYFSEAMKEVGDAITQLEVEDMK